MKKIKKMKKTGIFIFVCVLVINILSVYSFDLSASIQNNSQLISPSKLNEDIILTEQTVNSLSEKFGWKGNLTEEYPLIINNISGINSLHIFNMSNIIFKDLNWDSSTTLIENGYNIEIRDSYLLYGLIEIKYSSNIRMSNITLIDDVYGGDGEWHGIDIEHSQYIYIENNILYQTRIIGYLSRFLFINNNQFFNGSELLQNFVEEMNITNNTFYHFNRLNFESVYYLDYINNSRVLTITKYQSDHRFRNIVIGRFYDNSYQSIELSFISCIRIEFLNNYFNQSSIGLYSVDEFDIIDNEFRNKNIVITYKNNYQNRIINNTYDNPNDAIYDRDSDLDQNNISIFEIGIASIILALIGSNIYLFTKIRKS